jgi:hypothetical protein
MHAMPCDGITLEALANYYIREEKEQEENERMLELQAALSAVNVSMSDIPQIYTPLIQACIFISFQGLFKIILFILCCFVLFCFYFYLFLFLLVFLN